MVVRERPSLLREIAALLEHDCRNLKRILR
jgi:hypothetical protein